MNLVSRSRGATICLVVLVFLTWLAPGPLISSLLDNTASAAPKVKKPKKPRTNKGSAAARKHHVHIRSALKKLHEAKKNLASAPVPYGGHREKALQHIDHAIHQLKTLEHHVRKLAGKK